MDPTGFEIVGRLRIAAPFHAAVGLWSTAPDSFVEQTMPSVDGILETALYVTDLDQSERFYRELFGFPTLLAEERMRAMGVVGRQVLLLFQEGGTTAGVASPGGWIPPHQASGRIHMAFSIAEDQLDPWSERLQSKGIKIEGRTRGPRGKGGAVYFRDPDGHLIELANPIIWGFES